MKQRKQNREKHVVECMKYEQRRVAEIRLQHFFDKLNSKFIPLTLEQRGVNTSNAAEERLIRLWESDRPF